MGDTKEAILTTALQLFAGNGYEAVSVSEIAGALGMPGCGPGRRWTC